MPDVTKALILPAQFSPFTSELKNLALYWDELVLPSYHDSQVSDETRVLIDAGIVRIVDRSTEPITSLWQPQDVAPHAAEKREVIAFRYDERGTRHTVGRLRVDAAYLTDDNAVHHPEDDPRHTMPNSMISDISVMLRDQYLAEVNDALGLAASRNYAPLATSVSSHLASLTSVEGDVTARREAALISVAVEAFAIDASVGVDDVIALRDKTAVSRARLRASLADLSSRLSADAAPESLLSQARDTFKNRVEPALADLEDRLKENSIGFLIKSLLGATAIVMTPMAPVSSSAAGVRFIGQTLNYRFSKEGLVRDHPFGFLHQVAANAPLSSDSAAHIAPEAVELAASPEFRAWLDVDLDKAAADPYGAIERVWAKTLTSLRDLRERAGSERDGTPQGPV